MTLADWDGDGSQDLVVGAPMGDGPANDTVNSRDSGEAFVIDVRGVSGGVAAAAAPVRLTVYGAHAEDALGQSVAAGDMNGDGRPELAILAMRADRPDGSQEDTGAIYIISRP
jgi:FG-GAP repeat